MTRYSSTMSEAYEKVIYRDSISERDLTDAEEKRREEIAKDLPDQEFKDRYGARWKSVKMATATKMVKNESLGEAVRWKVKIEGLPSIYMDAGSASEVRTKLRKLVKQPDMIQDIDRVTDTQMKKDLRNRLAGKDSDPSAEVNERMEKSIEEAREKGIDKLPRQFLNPDKEVMIMKNNKVIVIDKKDQDKYMRQGWELAEGIADNRQKKIAMDTLKNPKKSILGGPSPEEAEKILKKKFGMSDKQIAKLKEEQIDEAVADLFVKKGDVNKIAVKIAKSAKGLGLKSGVMGNQVRIKGSQKKVNGFMGAVIGKSSLGDPSEVGASNPQIDKILNKQLKEEVELDEGRYVVHAKKQGKKPVGMMTIKHTIPNAKNEKDAIKQAIAMSKTSGGGLKGDEITQKDIVKVVKETLDEKLKFTHAVLEPDGNVLGFSSNERDAKDMARNNLRNVKGKVVTLKKPMAQRKGDKMIGYPLKEEVELDEQFDYVLLDKDNKIIARYKGRDAKKQAELNKKGAEKKLGVKKPIKVYPIRPTDKKKIGDTVLAIGEAKLIDKPTGEVLKTGSKKEMETERKRNRDELQVKEWFKSKGIDVTIRKLDDATQAYVRIGKIIPNEIREDLVKIQYGELPEDIKNTNNIVYGNFKENSITMNNEFWKKVFEARKDDPSQEQDTNIIMQLRKSVSLKGMKDVEFNDGKKVKVKPQIANAVMDKFDTYRTTDQKLKFQQKIAKSYKDLLSALKEK